MVSVGPFIHSSLRYSIRARFRGTGPHVLTGVILIVVVVGVLFSLPFLSPHPRLTGMTTCPQGDSDGDGLCDCSGGGGPGGVVGLYQLFRDAGQPYYVKNVQRISVTSCTETERASSVFQGWNYPQAGSITYSDASGSHTVQDSCLNGQMLFETSCGQYEEINRTAQNGYLFTGEIACQCTGGAGAATCAEFVTSASTGAEYRPVIDEIQLIVGGATQANAPFDNRVPTSILAYGQNLGANGNIDIILNDVLLDATGGAFTQSGDTITLPVPSTFTDGLYHLALRDRTTGYVSNIKVFTVKQDTSLDYPPANYNYNQVPMVLREVWGASRTNDIVSSGIPLPKGKVTSIGQLSLSAGGQVIPTQFDVLSKYWDDGSLKWVLATFVDSISANTQKNYTVSFTGGNPPPTTSISVLEVAGDRVEVNTGVLKAVLNLKAGSIFSSIMEDVNGNGVYDSSEEFADASKFQGAVITDMNNVVYDSAQKPKYNYSVLRRGPLTAIVEVYGTHDPRPGQSGGFVTNEVGALGLTNYYAWKMTITFTAGKPWMDVNWAIRNPIINDATGALIFKSYNFELPLSMSGGSMDILRGDLSGATSVQNYPTTGTSFGRFRMDLDTASNSVFIEEQTQGGSQYKLAGFLKGSNQGYLPYVKRKDATKEVAVAMKDMLGSYPQAFTGDVNGLTLEFFPSDGVGWTPYAVEDLVQYTKRMRWSFAAPGQNGDALAASLQHPLRPLADPNYLKDTRIGAMDGSLWSPALSPATIDAQATSEVNGMYSACGGNVKDKWGSVRLCGEGAGEDPSSANTGSGRVIFDPCYREFASGNPKFFDITEHRYFTNEKRPGGLAADLWVDPSTKQYSYEPFRYYEYGGKYTTQIGWGEIYPFPGGGGGGVYFSSRYKSGSASCDGRTWYDWLGYKYCSYKTGLQIYTHHNGANYGWWSEEDIAHMVTADSACYYMVTGDPEAKEQLLNEGNWVIAQRQLAHNYSFGGWQDSSSFQERSKGYMSVALAAIWDATGDLNIKKGLDYWSMRLSDKNVHRYGFDSDQGWHSGITMTGTGFMYLLGQFNRDAQTVFSNLADWHSRYNMFLLPNNNQGEIPYYGASAAYVAARFGQYANASYSTVYKWSIPGLINAFRLEQNPYAYLTAESIYKKTLAKNCNSTLYYTDKDCGFVKSYLEEKQRLDKKIVSFLPSGTVWFSAPGCDSCPNDPQNDQDKDGLCADADNCPTIFNPNQADCDADGIGDACDSNSQCGGTCNNNGVCESGEDAVSCPNDCLDTDGDGIADSRDNCPAVSNPSQSDCDADGIGDACDPSSGCGDITPPTLTVFILSDAKRVDHINVSVNMTSSDASGIDPASCKLSNDNVSFTSISCTPSVSWNLQKLNGQQSVFFQAKDMAGNVRTVSDTTVVDVYLNYSYYNGSTTNFSAANIFNVTGAVLQRGGVGSILFLQDIGFTSSRSLDKVTNITKNSIFINSTAIPALNRSATIVLYNLLFKDPRLLKDNVPCSSPQCTAPAYSGGTFSANVLGFSNYTLDEKPCVDQDGDGYNTTAACGAVDCNDANAAIHPGATETCDAVDNTCDGVVDEGCQCVPGSTQACGSDVGACAAGTQSCLSNGTWDTTCTSAVGPVNETCGNGIDEDCDGSDQQCPQICLDADLDGFLAFDTVSCVSGTDCNDNNASIHPGATDVCENGVDEDCSGADASCPFTPSGACSDGQTQSCGSSTGECTVGTQTCTAGVWGACVGSVLPVQEVCDGKDNNCNGQTDETTCQCQEGEKRACGSNIGACKEGTRVCDALGNWGSCSGAIDPATEDICGNGKDDDCNGQVDDKCIEAVSMCSNQAWDPQEEWIDCGGKCATPCAKANYTGLIVALLLIVVVVGIVLVESHL